MKRTRVFIDVYYYVAALSGIRTYINELKLSTENHGSENVEYIFSHDINKLANKKLYLNSSNQFIRWLFQFNYLIWKQVILPYKLLFYKPDYLICPDYVSPILTFSTKKITVIHDSLFWDYPKKLKMMCMKMPVLRMEYQFLSDAVVAVRYCKAQDALIMVLSYP